MARITPTLHDFSIYASNANEATASVVISAGSPDDLVVVFFVFDGTPVITGGSLDAFRADSRAIAGNGAATALFVGRRSDGIDGSMTLTWDVAERFAHAVYIFSGVDYAAMPVSAALGGPGWESDALTEATDFPTPPATTIGHENPNTVTFVGVDDGSSGVGTYPSAPGTSTSEQFLASGGGGSSATKIVVASRSGEWATAAGTSWGSLGIPGRYTLSSTGDNAAIYWFCVYGPEDAPPGTINLTTQNLYAHHEIQENYITNDQGFVSWPDEDISATDLQTEEGQNPALGTIHPKLSDSDTSTWIANIDDRSPTVRYICGTTSDKAGQGLEIDSIDSLSASIVTALSGTLDNDILEVGIQLFETDGITQLTDRMLISSAQYLSTEPNQSARINVVFTGVQSNPYLYTDSQVVLDWQYTRTGGTDNLYILVGELRIYGLFTPTVFIDLTADNLETRTQIQSAAKTVEANATTDNLEAETQIQSGEFFQSLSLQTPGLVADHEIQQVDQVGQIIPLTTTDLIAWHEIQRGAFTIAFNLVTDNLTNAQEIQSGAVDVDSNLTSWSLEGRNQIEAGSIAGFIRYTMDFPFNARGTVITADDLASFNEIQSGGVVIVTTVFADNLELVAEIQSGEVTAIIETLLAFNLGNEGEIQSASVGQFQDLTTTNLSSDADIQSGAINKDLTFFTQNLSGPTEIESVSVAPIIFLSSDSLTADTSIQSAAISKSLNFFAENLSADTEIQAGFILAPGTLVPQNIAAETTITSGEVETDHTLFAPNLVGDSDITDVELFIPFHNLFTTALVSTPTIKTVWIGQERDLEAGSLEATGTVQSGTLTAIQFLTAGNLRGDTAIQSGAFFKEGDMRPDNLYGHNEIQSGEFEIIHVLTAAPLSSTGEIQSGLCNTEQDFLAANLVGPTEIQAAQVPYELQAEGIEMLPEIQSGIIDDMRNPNRHPIDMVIGV